jgi:hypothetical protein
MWILIELMEHDVVDIVSASPKEAGHRKNGRYFSSYNSSLNGRVALSIEYKSFEERSWR